MNAHPSASPTALLVRDDLPDLDRLVQLACQTGSVPAALLVEWTLPQPLVLGRHGLDPHQADLALQACLQALSSPERDTCIPDLTAHPMLAGHPLVTGPSAWRFLHEPTRQHTRCRKVGWRGGQNRQPRAQRPSLCERGD